MTPCSSVAMIEKLALVRMAFCNAPAFSAARMMAESTGVSRSGAIRAGSPALPVVMDMVSFGVLLTVTKSGAGVCTLPHIRPKSGGRHRGGRVKANPRKVAQQPLELGL